MQHSTQQKIDHRHFMVGGMIASFTASICCLGPLVLLATGVSGAWMSKLMLLERYQPILIAITLTAFILAAQKIFYVATKTDDSECCAEKKPSWKQLSAFAASCCLALLFISSEYWIQFLA